MAHPLAHVPMRSTWSRHLDAILFVREQRVGVDWSVGQLHQIGDRDSITWRLDPRLLPQIQPAGRAAEPRAPDMMRYQGAAERPAERLLNLCVRLGGLLRRRPSCLPHGH